jgi:hypothetical protein
LPVLFLNRPEKKADPYSFPKPIEFDVIKIRFATEDTGDTELFFPTLIYAVE